MKESDFETREDYARYKLAEWERERRESLQPWLEAKARAMALMMPKRIVLKDGVIVEYSQGDQAMLAQYDNAIKSLLESIMPPEHLLRWAGLPSMTKTTNTGDGIAMAEDWPRKYMADTKARDE